VGCLPAHLGWETSSRASLGTGLESVTTKPPPSGGGASLTKEDSPQSSALPEEHPRVAWNKSRIAAFGVIVVAAVVFTIVCVAIRFSRNDREPASTIAARTDGIAAKPIIADQRSTADAPSAPSPTISPDQRPEQESERFRSLIKKATHLHKDGEEGIRRGVRQMIIDAKNEGLSLSPEEAIEGSLLWPMPGYFSRVPNVTFADYVKIYRIAGMKDKPDHRERIRQMHRMASALHVVDKSVSTDIFEAAFVEATPGCQLAMIESLDIIRPDDPLAEHYQSLAEHVGGLYGQPPNLIGASVAYVISQVKLAGKSGHPAEVLDAATAWPPLLESRQTGEETPNFGKFLVEYFEAQTGNELVDDASISDLNR
jgi:hypothetical protein